MTGFIDEITIAVSSGSGGSGCVSFRRERCVPRGGPDGGDGGRGGGVLFEVRDNLKTLVHLRQRPVFKAGDGQPGRGRRQHGRNGVDVRIPVPPGTVLKDPDTGKVLMDLIQPGEINFLQGGVGGRGNWHFSTPTKRAPRYAQPGLPGRALSIRVELSMIADVGFVGLPNAGKSSLLRRLTSARPKVGNYPFTTKIPNLGVLHWAGGELILADIPGIIEGASRGIGLGLKFLKHISRTRLLLFLVDLSEGDPDRAFELLKEELGEYAPDLLDRPRLLVGTKLDIQDPVNSIERLSSAYPDERILGLSSYSGEGIEEMISLTAGMIHQVG